MKTIVGWTNALRPTIQNEAFAAGDYSRLREYVDFYENDRGSQDYGPSKNIPDEYGYILIDLVEKTILSAQDYTNVGTQLGLEIKMAMQNDPTTADERARLVTSLKVWNDDTDDWDVVPVGPFRDAAHMAEDREAWYVGGNHLEGMPKTYVIDLPGWTLSHAQPDAEQFEKVRDYLAQRALLSPEEIGIWNGHIDALHAQRAEEVRDRAAKRGGIAP